MKTSTATVESIPPERLARFEAFVRAIGGTTRVSAMYPAGHPMLQESIRVLSAATDDWFRLEPKLAIAFTPDTIRLDGAPVKEKDALCRSVADYMHQRGLLGLSIARGVTGAELSSLVDAIKATPEAIAEAGGVAKKLRAGTHIVVKEIDYRSLLSSSRTHTAAADPARLWDSLTLFSDDLDRGGMSSSKWASLLEKLKDPGAVAASLSMAVEKAGADQGAVTQRIWKLIGGIGQEAGAQPPSQARFVRQLLSVIVTKLNPELVHNLFAGDAADPTIDRAQDVVLDSMPDQAVTDILISLIDKEGKINRNLVALFEKLSTRKDKSEVVSGLMAKQLAAANRTTASGLDAVQAAIRQAFASTPANKFLSRVYELTIAKLPETVTAADALPPAITALIQEYQALALPENLIVERGRLLLNVLWFEESPEAFRRFAALLGECLRDCPPSQVASLSHDALVMLLNKAANTKGDAECAREADTGVRQVLRQIGVQTLTSLIAESPEAEFKGLGRYLVDAGSSSEDAILRAFRRSASDVVKRRFAYVLGEMSGSPKQVQMTVKLLRRERSPQMRKALWTGLLQSGDGSALAMLFAEAGKGLFGRQCLLELTQYCGLVRANAAVPHLGEILVRRRLLDWIRGSELQRTAAASLGQIGSAEALPLLRSGAEVRNPSVRAACRQALTATPARTGAS